MVVLQQVPRHGATWVWGPVRGLACDEGQADCQLPQARAASPGRRPGRGCRMGLVFAVLAAAGLVAHRRVPRLSPGLPQVPADGKGQDTPSLLLQEPLLSCVPHCYAQEVSRLCHLPAGAYHIVPSTYLPDTEGAFTVTVETRIDRWAPGSARALCMCMSPAPPPLVPPGTHTSRLTPVPQSTRPVEES